MTDAAFLVDTLEGLGVHLSVTPAGRLAVVPVSVIKPELMELLKEQRDSVLEFLHSRAAGPKKTPGTPETPGNLHSTSKTARCFSGVSERPPPETPGQLPEPLVRLVRAAVCNQLNHPAPLNGGTVPNLGEYVLACAALYACGYDPEGQLKALWAARGAWAAYLRPVP